MEVKDIIIKNHYRFINYHHFHNEQIVNLKTAQIWNLEVNKQISIYRLFLAHHHNYCRLVIAFVYNFSY